MKNIYHAGINEKETGVVLSISAYVDYKQRKLLQEAERDIT